MANNGDIFIRRGRDSDAPSIAEIYNHYIAETPITFDIEPKTVEDRAAWIRQFSYTGGHQLFVAERGGETVGYAGSIRHASKAAYDTTVESTIYLKPGLNRLGIGRRLYGTLFHALAREDVRSVLAGVTLPNPASIAFHQRFGFAKIGIFHEVGRKFGRYHDVLWLEKRL